MSRSITVAIPPILARLKKATMCIRKDPQIIPNSKEQVTFVEQYESNCHLLHPHRECSVAVSKEKIPGHLLFRTTGIEVGTGSVFNEIWKTVRVFCPEHGAT